MTTYRYISDPGHGWLEVPMNEINKLALLPKLSSYSYISPDGKFAYLEEDVDAGVFINAVGLSNANVIDVNVNEQSHIRRFPRLKQKEEVLYDDARN